MAVIPAVTVVAAEAIQAATMGVGEAITVVVPVAIMEEAITVVVPAGIIAAEAIMAVIIAAAITVTIEVMMSMYGSDRTGAGGTLTTIPITLIPTRIIINMVTLILITRMRHLIMCRQSPRNTSNETSHLPSLRISGITAASQRPTIHT